MTPATKPVTTYAAVFGGVLHLRRTTLRVSQEALANACGISQPLLSRIERGESAPTIETVARMAAHFKEQPSNIFRDVELSIAKIEANGIQVLPYIDEAQQAAKAQENNATGDTGMLFAILGGLALGGIILAAISADSKR